MILVFNLLLYLKRQRLGSLGGSVSKQLGGSRSFLGAGEASSMVSVWRVLGARWTGELPRGLLWMVGGWGGGLQTESRAEMQEGGRKQPTDRSSSERQPTPDRGRASGPPAVGAATAQVGGGLAACWGGLAGAAPSVHGGSSLGEELGQDLEVSQHGRWLDGGGRVGSKGRWVPGIRWGSLPTCEHLGAGSRQCPRTHSQAEGQLVLRQ